MDKDRIDIDNDGEGGSLSLPELTELHSGEKSRRRIEVPEQFDLDHKAAQRLETLGFEPRLPHQVILRDVATQETLELENIREHWMFARTAKTRAAQIVAEFTAFCQQADTSNYRGYVLRPPFKKGEIGDLRAEIERLSTDYDNLIGKARQDEIAFPLLSMVHIRFDSNLGLWDVHLHCILDVKSENLDALFRRLCRRFSTPYQIEKLASVGAWANYCASWTLDHRQIAGFPAEAMAELWNLKNKQLIRTAGTFAAFRRGLRGKTLHWVDDRVVIKTKEPPISVRNGTGSPERNPEQVGYRVVTWGGEKRLCAIIRRARLAPVGDARIDQSRKAHSGGEDALPAPIGSFQVPTQVCNNYSTASTGAIPTILTRKEKFAAQDLCRALERRSRPRIAIWCRIWNYGFFDPAGSGWAGTIPRPIRRRISKMLTRSNSLLASEQRGAEGL